jgi:glycosyltransferase involved in cell wall biosynthesis
VSLRAAAVVTAGSVTLFRAASGVAPGVSLRLLPLGVDLAMFSPLAGATPSERAGCAGAAPRLFFAGSLTPVKDPVLLLRAFARVGDRHATLDVAGEGPLRPGLERLASSLGVGERVRFLGAVARPDLADRYRAADLLVAPSRHEAQSMVVAEAAACGLPVVGRAVGIVPELAAAGGAIAIADGGPLELAAAIDDALRPAARDAMCLAARACAARAWDLDRSVTRWSGLWTELAAHRVNRPPS